MTLRRPLACFGAAIAVVAGLLSGTTAAHAASTPTIDVGVAPTAVAVDSATHTVYAAVADNNTSQIVIANASTCSTTSTSTCAVVATVTLADQADPSALAVDDANGTLYVADSGTGDVALINTATCNATTTSGCATAPTTEAFALQTPSAIAVDTSASQDTVYVADEEDQSDEIPDGSVTVFDGATCSATTQTGCGTSSLVTVGSAPDAIAVDAAAQTVYVANLGDDTISTLSEAACSTLSAACTTTGTAASLTTGDSPAALAVDGSTVYVAESGTGAVGLLNATTCNASTSTGCGTVVTDVPVGDTPDALAVESSGFVVVGDQVSHSVSTLQASVCNATTQSGCSKLGSIATHGAIVSLAANGSTVYAADGDNHAIDVLPNSAKPTITAKLTSAHKETKYHWFRSPVTITFTCHDVAATVACPKPVTLKASGKHRTVTRTVTASDGLSATITVVVNIDRDKPHLTITGVKSGHHYKHSPHLHCTAKDSLSGIAKKCHITKHKVKHSHRVDYTATATDKAGNVAKKSGHYYLEG